MPDPTTEPVAIDQNLKMIDQPILELAACHDDWQDRLPQLISVNAVGQATPATLAAGMRKRLIILNS